MINVASNVQMWYHNDPLCNSVTRTIHQVPPVVSGWACRLLGRAFFGIFLYIFSLTFIDLNNLVKPLIIKGKGLRQWITLWFKSAIQWIHFSYQLKKSHMDQISTVFADVGKSLAFQMRGNWIETLLSFQKEQQNCLGKDGLPSTHTGSVMKI